MSNVSNGAGLIRKKSLESLIILSQLSFHSAMLLPEIRFVLVLMRYFVGLINGTPDKMLS